MMGEKVGDACCHVLPAGARMHGKAPVRTLWTAMQDDFVHVCPAYVLYRVYSSCLPHRLHLFTELDYDHKQKGALWNFSCRQTEAMFTFSLCIHEL